MSLSLGLNPWLFAGAALVAAAFAFWVYGSTVPELPLAKRVVLGVLRFGALLLILFLLFEPILRLIDRDEKPAVLAVLVDDSQSLLLTAGEDSTGSAARSRVRDVFSQLPAEVGNADVRFFRFSDEVSSLEGEAFSEDSLTLNGTRTNIARALEEVSERLKDDNFSAVLLVSDGQYNAGRNPLYVAERYPVPIYTAVLGDTTRRRDVQVWHVTTNDIAYVGTELPVQVDLRTEDVAGEQVMVSLFRDGTLIESRPVSLPEGSTEISVDLTTKPDTQGLQRYSVAVSRLSGEVTYRNNVESFTVRVLDTRRRVLLLAAAPGPDVAALKQLLENDPTFDLSTFVQKSTGTFYEGPLPQDLGRFNVIVLAGFPGSAAGRETSSRVARAAAEGTPLLFVLTRDTDVALLREQFAEVLPALPERLRSGFIEATFVPTARSMTHPIMNIPDATPELWKRLPPLLYNQSRWQATPDAEVLASIEVRGVQLPDPIFVVRRRSSHRSAALLGAGSWRWKNVPEDLAQIEHFWPGLFANAVQWLSAREDDRPVRVIPARDLFAGGENVRMTGQVYDESLNPVGDASVEVRIHAPDGTVTPYSMNPIGNGRYTLDAGTFPEGTYRYEATARREDAELGSDQGAFAVGALTLEFKETSANAALMRQIAARSGGEFVDAISPGDFGAQLAASGAFEPVVVEQEREIELRRRYIFLAIIIVLLATEWFVRKRSGMV